MYRRACWLSGWLAFSQFTTGLTALSISCVLSGSCDIHMSDSIRRVISRLRAYYSRAISQRRNHLTILTRMRVSGEKLSLWHTYFCSFSLPSVDLPRHWKLSKKEIRQNHSRRESNKILSKYKWQYVSFIPGIRTRYICISMELRIYIWGKMDEKKDYNLLFPPDLV